MYIVICRWCSIFVWEWRWSTRNVKHIRVLVLYYSNKINFNSEKSKIVHFRTQSVTRSNFPFIFNGKEVDIVSKYTYLNLLLTEFLSSISVRFKPHLRRCCGRCYRKRPWPDVTWVTWLDVRVYTCATGSWAISALVGSFHRRLRYETSPVVTEGHVTPNGGGRECVVAKRRCAISVLVGPFLGKWRHR